MNWFYFINILCSFVFPYINATNNNFTFTYARSLQCKEFVAQHGYTYDTFFEIESLRYRGNSTDVIFEMHIAILAASNGHIVLSPTMKPGTTDGIAVYEIVVGGGANKFTELRKNLRRNAKASVRSIGILSAIELRPFYIRLKDDGTIEFGRPNDALPLISFFDVNPIVPRYFGFAAWNGVEAKFFFDCPPPSFNTSEHGANTAPSSDDKPNEVSQVRQLKQTLLSGKDPFIAPELIMNVELGVTITNVDYDAFESILTTGMSVVMKWTLNGMSWDPNKFFNITSLKFGEGQIWQPRFFAMNSDNASPLQTSWLDQPVLLDSDGNAMLYFHSELNSYCVDYSESYSKWPRDEYHCAIVLQPWENHEHILLSILPEQDATMLLVTELSKPARNEWELKSLQKVVSASKWNQVMFESDNDGSQHNSDRLLIDVKLTRIATTYNVVFYTPILVLITFVLMSFWMEPLKMSRVWFYVGVTILLCMGLSFVDEFIPIHTVPSILVLYNTVLAGVLLALLIQLILMKPTAEKLCSSPAVQTLLSQRYLRIIFCLPELKTCRTYHSFTDRSFEDEDSLPVINSNVEQLERDDTNAVSERDAVAECVDKLLFVVYSLTVAVMFAMHF